ncbi:MAG: helicase [Bathelium mastoideum]|nr:MAG: helicase [Bathelium mastoideum]
MIVKPFKPPLIARKSSEASSPRSSEAPPLKKRRINQEEDEIKQASTPLTTSLKPTNTFRKPLLSVVNTSTGQVGTKSGRNEIDAFYTVLWRRFTNKKNKTWDGDGTLLVSGGFASLQDLSGRHMGKAPCDTPLLPGSTLSIGGKDVEVDSVISRQQFTAGGAPSTGDRADPVPQAPISKFKPPTASPAFDAKGSKLASQQKRYAGSIGTQNKPVNAKFQAPLASNSVLPKNEDDTRPVPRHDPDQAGALVMTRPNQIPKEKKVVDVVVDPLLSKHLREHQRKGVSFLYECVMGMRDFGGEGAILADEMGLGKTLQTIALLWTLLKQNPVHNDPPVIKKALIVCPVSLINNWRKEFRKWLGNERIGVLVADEKRTRLTDFTLGKSYSVMVIGYEKLRTVQEDLKKGAGVDIVIADEGHRLKTAQNKSALAIKSLNTERRVILSGTPIQNDLSEFFTMVDFVNPGLLGRYNTFKREYERPIVKSRQPEASAEDTEKGESKSAELASLTGQFILRRTAEILSQFLPPKTEYVLFCRPTSAQKDVYRSIISSPAFNSILGSPEASLQLINILKKVCNSPSLLKGKNSDDAPSSPLVKDVLSSISQSTLSYPGSSAKLQVLDSLLHHLRSKAPQEKVVLVSNYTSTLDMLGTLLTSLSYPFLRLDGTIPASQRQTLVDRFNRTPSSTTFAFLLSAKSGGTGLNLIGASRLVLFDADWNPATDAQAMARIHRDGQKRPVVIYRLLLKGTMDEKIFQRQRMKLSLADAVVDGKKSVQAFSGDELRDLFKLEEGKGCRTHVLLGCACGGRGGQVSRIEKGDETEDEDDHEKENESRHGNGGAVEKGENSTRYSTEDLLRSSSAIRMSQLSMEGFGMGGLGMEDLGMEDLGQGQGQWLGRKTVKDTEQARLSKGEEKKVMPTLMQYKHVDTLRIASRHDERLDMVVEDDVLRDMLKVGESRVDFVFARNGC